VIFNPGERRKWNVIFVKVLLVFWAMADENARAAPATGASANAFILLRRFGTLVVAIYLVFAVVEIC
jgi:hypothetical protein